MEAKSSVSGEKATRVKGAPQGLGNVWITCFWSPNHPTVDVTTVEEKDEGFWAMYGSSRIWRRKAVAAQHDGNGKLLRVVEEKGSTWSRGNQLDCRTGLASLRTRRAWKGSRM